MRKNLRIYSLHGFLGLPSDWDNLPLPTRKIDVFRMLSPASGASAAEWACRLNESIAQDREGSPRVLLGYSLGGRLAMHALTAAPELWDAAVLVSANPGIPPEDRPARLATDECWARRFERENWEDLCMDWQGLPAFCGEVPPFRRLECNYRRDELAGALRFWSLGHQEDLSDRLADLPLPLLWVAGEKDRRYVELGRTLRARALRRGRRFDLWIAPGAGHRVPWEAQEAFAEQFCGFLDRVLLLNRPVHTTESDRGRSI